MLALTPLSRMSFTVLTSSHAFSLAPAVLLLVLAVLLLPLDSQPVGIV
jgi:hypothetical protein